MPFLLILVLQIISHTFASPLGIQEEWSRVSDPLIMDHNYETRFYALPLNGEVAHLQKFWSGDYWPLNRGNINYRWNASPTFNMPSPSLIQAQSMSQQELAQLSPAEKFDLLNGRYSYPLKQEVIGISNPNAQYWEGICHGWAPAAMNHNEPTPKNLKNRDGIMVPFGSSDIKGILSYYYAYPYHVPDTHQVGRRCNENDCIPDLNAGAFHIVLTNKVGLEKIGFIADMAANKEVWNHPIMSYNSKILSDGHGPASNSAPGTTRTVLINTTINYSDESDNNWNTVQGTRLQHIATMKLSYLVEINVYGQIIGGEWRSVKKPDFLWTMERPARFIGTFSKLSGLLND